MPLIINFLRVILLPFFKWIWTWLTLIFPAILSFFKWFWNIWKSLLTPIFGFLTDNWLKILILWVFIWFAFNFVFTLFLFVLYTLSVALHLWLGNYATQFTVSTITNAILWTFIMIIWVILYKLFKK